MRKNLFCYPTLYLHTGCWNCLRVNTHMWKFIIQTAFTYSSIVLQPIRIKETHVIAELTVQILHAVQNAPQITKYKKNILQLTWWVRSRQIGLTLPDGPHRISTRSLSAWIGCRCPFPTIDDVCMVKNSPCSTGLNTWTEEWTVVTHT
jgi:hypothetical protein